MLSVDQFLRLISVPAVVMAFLIASQISGGVYSRPGHVQMASELGARPRFIGSLSVAPMIAVYRAVSEPPAMLFDRGFRLGTRDRRLSQFLRGG